MLGRLKGGRNSQNLKRTNGIDRLSDETQMSILST
jgi:hypothetical protein